MLSEKENNASPFLSFCCYFCLPFCKERELTGCRSSKKELPVNKLDTFYEISFKTNEISKISFPLKFYIGDQKFSLVFPMSSSKINDLKQPFGLNPYSYFPRNQTFILEKYPYFIISSLFETHLTLSYETTDPLKFELDNNELNSQMFMEIFYNYLAFKLNEILEIDLNFSIYLNLTTNPNFSNLRALQKFSDYLIKFDQSPFFKVFYRKYIIEKTRRNSEYIKENEYKTINFLQNFEEISRMHYKANNFNKENELIIGNLQRFKTMKIKADIILINCYHAVENRELLIVTKELLIKAIFKALNLSKNIVILLHKTFPLELIPEIFDTSWSCFKDEPKNFSIEMEFLFVNNILEGFFIYWGEVSSVSYQETINYLFHILYPLPYIQKDEEAIKKQQILLQEKFLKHGLRIFQKVMFSYKHDEKNKNLHDILFSLMSYMLNNNLITFRDAKFFPFFKKLITSSLKSLHSHRKISSGSKEKIFFFDDSSSLLERSNYSRNKNNPSSEKNLVSNEDLDKINLSYKKQNIRKNICKELSFKTSQSLKIKDSWFPSSKSKEFNLVLRSLDSDAEMEFSSYSGEEKDSEIEIETFGHHYRVKKVETLKKAFKNSMSFSFD